MTNKNLCFFFSYLILYSGFCYADYHLLQHDPHHCGGDLVINQFRAMIVLAEGYLTALSVASAVPGVGMVPAGLSIVLAGTAGSATFVLVESMDNSLEYDQRSQFQMNKFDVCKNIIKELRKYNAILRGTGLALTLCSFIPVIGIACVLPKIGMGISAAAVISSEFGKWKQSGCVGITKYCVPPSLPDLDSIPGISVFKPKT